MYKSGKQHLDADYLSRYPQITEPQINVNIINYGRRGTYNPRDENSTEPEDIQVEYIPLVDLSKIKEAQKQDDRCSGVIRQLDQYGGRFAEEEDLLVYVDRSTAGHVKCQSQ